MIIKYGKSSQMREINRTLDWIKNRIDFSRQQSEKFYVPPSKNTIPQCKICGCKNAKLFLTAWNKYRYYECENCGSIFLYDIPDTKKMYLGYETVVGTIYANDAIFEKRVNMISNPKVHFILDICKESKIPVTQWLDLGCGTGEILQCLKGTNIKAIGIEPDKNNYEFATKRGLNVINQYIDIEDNNSQLSSLIQQSDIVSIFGVIEHIIDPVALVSYILSHMRHGSFFVFEVPRHPSMASFANMTCNYGSYRHISSPGHLYVFSDKSLTYLLGNESKIVGKWEFGQGYTDLVNNAMLLSGQQESSLYINLLNLSNKIQPIIDEMGLADTMLVVTQKVMK